MKISKFTMTISALTFLSLSGEMVVAENSNEIIEGFQGIKQGAANEKTCKDKCTGNGIVESGTCSDLNVYLACKYACKPEHMPDCQKAAEKEKYYNLVAQCNPKTITLIVPVDKTK